MSGLAVDPVDMLRDRVRDAANAGTGLRIAGRGTWMDAGRPVLAPATLSTSECSGIIDYVSDDLTLTARAGTTLAEIHEATSAHGQWLALDPYGSDAGSLGATLATNSSGPLTAAFGQPRDLALGVAFVTGSGVLARGGGRVVKNVAGFDLTRLTIGAWGTLGVITEATVRLHARPEADVTIAVPFDDAASGVGRVRTLLRRLPFTPYACEILNRELAVSLVGNPRATVLVRLGGNTGAVRAQRAAFVELGTVSEADPGVWQRLRQSEPPGALVVRLSRLASEIGLTWRDAAAIADACPGTQLHASPARGVVRCIVPQHDGAERKVTSVLASITSTRVGEHLPSAAWSVLPAPSRDPLSVRVRTAFDPQHILNPGIMGELI